LRDPGRVNPGITIERGKMKRTFKLTPALCLAISAFGQYQDVVLFKAPDAAHSPFLSLCSVNNSGLVAADAFIGGVFRGYTMKDGNFALLPPLPGYDGVFISDLNDKGDVVGLSYKPGGGFMDRVGTIWKNGIAAALPAPAPSVPGNPIYFNPVAINAAGTIIGVTTELLQAGPPTQFASKAVILQGGVYADAPSPPVANPQLLDINDQGDILVQAFGFPAGYSFYILRQGAYTEVQIADAYQVKALNNRGDILGITINEDYIYYANGQSRIFPKLLGTQNTYVRSLTSQGRTCGSAVAYNSLVDIQTNNFLMRFH
jgi:hypothetical protein